MMQCAMCEPLENGTITHMKKCKHLHSLCKAALVYLFGDNQTIVDMGTAREPSIYVNDSIWGIVGKYSISFPFLFKTNRNEACFQSVFLQKTKRKYLSETACVTAILAKPKVVSTVSGQQHHSSKKYFHHTFHFLQLNSLMRCIFDSI